MPRWWWPYCCPCSCPKLLDFRKGATRLMERPFLWNGRWEAWLHSGYKLWVGCLIHWSWKADSHLANRFSSWQLRVIWELLPLTPYEITKASEPWLKKNTVIVVNGSHQIHPGKSLAGWRFDFFLRQLAFFFVLAHFGYGAAQKGVAGDSLLTPDSFPFSYGSNSLMYALFLSSGWRTSLIDKMYFPQRPKIFWSMILWSNLSRKLARHKERPTYVL